MLTDVDDDARLLLAAFRLLSPQHRSDLLERACVAAVMAGTGAEETERYYQSRWSSLYAPVPTPEMLTSRFLTQYMPRVPCGYRDDFGFEDAYRMQADSVAEQRALRYVCCSTELDDNHADELLCDLWECATSVGPSFGMPDFDHPHGPEVTGDGFLDISDVRAFIEKWRENFEGALLELAPNEAEEGRRQG